MELHWALIMMMPVEGLEGVPCMDAIAIADGRTGVTASFRRELPADSGYSRVSELLGCVGACERSRYCISQAWNMEILAARRPGTQMFGEYLPRSLRSQWDSRHTTTLAIGDVRK